MSATPSLSDLRVTCESCRAVLEALLGNVLPDVPLSHRIAGSCLYGCVLLSLAIQKFTGADATICGGDGAGDGGLLDPNGTLRGHYWVEGVLPLAGLEFVADITADQFGYAAVVVVPKRDAPQYIRGNQARVDAHVRQEFGAIAASRGKAD